MNIGTTSKAIMVERIGGPRTVDAPLKTPTPEPVPATATATEAERVLVGASV